MPGFAASSPRADVIANRVLEGDVSHRLMKTFALRNHGLLGIGFCGGLSLWALSASAADEKMAILKAGSQRFTNVTVIKVTYRSLDIPNVNYYFCFKDSWVDLHLSQPLIDEGEKISLSDFESRFRYGGE